MRTQPMEAASRGSRWVIADQNVGCGVSKRFHVTLQPLALSTLGLDGRWRNSLHATVRMESVDCCGMASFVISQNRGKGRQVDSPGTKRLNCDPADGGVLHLTSTSVATPHSNIFVEIDDDDSDDELNVYRGLVLDVSYRPVNVVCWKRALCLEILEKADVLEYYDQAVMSTTRAFPIPAVLRVNSFIHSPKHKKVKLALNRNNIFLRDKFRCQYCNVRDSLTIDHVQAVSRGGPWTWENLVTACSPCNLKKGDKTLEEAHMKLLRPPREPNELDSIDVPPNYKTFRSLSTHARTPVQWLDYLPRRPPQF